MMKAFGVRWRVEVVAKVETLPVFFPPSDVFPTTSSGVRVGGNVAVIPAEDGGTCKW